MYNKYFSVFDEVKKNLLGVVCEALLLAHQIIDRHALLAMNEVPLVLLYNIGP